ncbi:MAG: type I-U CRISPR-associated protein Csx17 [Firmicutes bacterium]|nr:type I-U CRISPR-associated protein Csx17 [Bacillota bacterium]
MGIWPGNSSAQRIRLEGCTPDPLLSYLKALGVLRLVAEQADRGARGYWDGESFVLLSALDRPALEQFFLTRYAPTPILAPWNGGSGFWGREGDLRILEESGDPRLELYRQTIAATRRIIRQLKITKASLQGAQTKEAAKKGLILACRASWPEAAVNWLDAVCAIADERVKFPHLLGAGGTDGNLEFTRNFMVHLAAALGLSQKPGTAGTSDASGRRKRGRSTEPGPSTNGGYGAQWLQAALYGCGSPPVLAASPGLFDSGSVGGPNSTEGFEGEALANPWDYVLGLEGTLLFAGAVVRRLGVATGGRSSFPFTVENSAVGYGTSVDAEQGDAGQSEMWLPLWDNPAAYEEIVRLFAEGRAQLGRHMARTGLEFARAVRELGVARGVRAFQRYGIFRKRVGGENYHAAVAIGRLDVRERPAPYLDRLHEIDAWLQTVRRACGAAGAPERFRRALRQIDAAAFALCENPDSRRLQGLLMSLGCFERALATSPKFREEGGIPPLQGLSPGWLRDADDGSTEYRLALGLASIGNAPDALPVRLQLEPLRSRPNGRFKWADDDHGLAWEEQPLAANLAAILEHRYVLASRSDTFVPPTWGRFTVSLQRVQAYLKGGVDERKTADLLWGLLGIAWQKVQSKHLPAEPRHPAPALSRAYALIKLVFLPGALRAVLLPDGASAWELVPAAAVEGGGHAEEQTSTEPGSRIRMEEQAGAEQGIRIRPEPAIFTLLRAGGIDGAVQLAARRLISSGLVPLGTRRSRGAAGLNFVCTAEEKRRLLGALLFPIGKYEVASLAAMVVRAPVADSDQQRTLS